MVTVLRVATGVASLNPSPNQTTVIEVPKLNESVAIPSSTPQFQNPVGSSLDASFLLALSFVAANIIVIAFLAYLYRKKKMKLFSLFVSIFLVFNVTELYFSFVLGLYSFIPTVAALIGVVLTLVAAFGGFGKLANGLAIVVALELGSAFPVILQAPLNWIIPAVYAVFDVYAVYFGRMGKLVREVTSNSSLEQADSSEGEEYGKKKQSKGVKDRLSKWKDFGFLSVTVGEIEIGMADLAFYSMVPAVALILKSLFAFFVVVFAVDAGLIASFFVFRKKDVSPGLPIPILSGLAGLMILFLI